jgi:chorismate mutase / prephenate dehydratase
MGTPVATDRRFENADHSPALSRAGLTPSDRADTNTAMGDASPDDLDRLRQQIDACDARLVELLNERAGVVVRIGRLKQQTNSPVYAPDREKAVLEKIRRLNKGPLSDRCLEAVWRELMSGSFALEKPLRIGFLGPEGTFSHLAAVRKFGSGVEHVPLSDITVVFEEIGRGHIDYGLVPVENSIGGGIVDTLDAFQHHTARICAEVLVAVHHNLLAHEPWEQITAIASKPEVFAQCRKFLADVAKGRRIEPASSTAAAAESAARQPGMAAIASELAGELYGLRTLFESIEDNPDNVTRFFVIGREGAGPTGDDKTAILFTTAHKPGTLADVLAVFKNHGINLTDIEKRPSKRLNWEYNFFIDAQGHVDDPAMAAAIEEARAHCLQLTVLGSYPRATGVA